MKKKKKHYLIYWGNNLASIQPKLLYFQTREIMFPKNKGIWEIMVLEPRQCNQWRNQDLTTHKQTYVHIREKLGVEEQLCLTWTRQTPILTKIFPLCFLFSFLFYFIFHIFMYFLFMYLFQIKWKKIISYSITIFKDL